MDDRIENIFIIFPYCIEVGVVAVTSDDLDKLVKESVSCGFKSTFLLRRRVMKMYFIFCPSMTTKTQG